MEETPKKKKTKQKKNKQELEIINEEEVEEIEPKKSKALIISIVILSVVLLSVLLIFLVPKIKKSIEISKLKKEINNIIKNKNIDDINKMISKNKTSGKLKEVEEKIEKYALEIISLSNSLDNIVNNKKINTSLLASSIDDSELLSLYEEKTKELTEMKEKLTSITEEGNKYKNYNKIYK